MADADLLYGGSDFWNPNAPKLDPNTGQYGTPPPAAPTPAPSPDAGRWSYQLHNKPSWVTPENEAWAKSIYDDPNSDPNQAIQQYLSGQRAGSGRTDEGDAEALARMGRKTPTVPNQFDDPYTNLLENISKSQMGEIRSNPALNQLTQFLNSQFQDLSQSPGFSPAEMSVLNTQAFEPIEEMRKAAQQRSLQRTASRGFLPSSGLAELDARNIDQDFDKLRTVANRDLAVRGIDRRDSDLNRAGQIAQLLGLQIPQGQRAEELGLATGLYNLPRNALNDALAVLNGSPSTGDLFSGANLLAQQQQYQQQMNAQRWAAIAQFLSGMI